MQLDMLQEEKHDNQEKVDFCFFFFLSCCRLKDLDSAFDVMIMIFLEGI